MTDEAHVLLVDDDYTLLRAYKNALNARGIVVETAMDGLDAKARLDKVAFDVVVSDINMPGYGGLEFLRAVRERDLDVPVVLMTGRPSIDWSFPSRSRSLPLPRQTGRARGLARDHPPGTRFCTGWRGSSDKRSRWWASTEDGSAIARRSKQVRQRDRAHVDGVPTDCRVARPRCVWL